MVVENESDKSFPTATAVLTRSQYASLTTFRADGSPVATAVWFVVDGGVVYLRTGLSTSKVARIDRTPAVELQSCNYRGRTRSKSPVVTGIAHVTDADEQRHGENLLKKRYGWQWNIVPLIPLPGLSNPHPGLTLRERIAWAKATDPWPGTCILRIDLSDTLPPPFEKSSG